MRALTYIMADGTEVKTLAEAKAGGKYTAKLTEIPEPTHTAPKQIAEVAVVFGIED